MKRRLPGASLLLLALPLLCSANAGIVLEDDAGMVLAFTQPAERIVTLAPHLAEMIFDLGAGERLVGTVEWSDHPAAAKAVPRIGNSSRIDIERIIALAPDIVLAWGGGTPPRTIERLRDMKLPVAVLTPRDLASIPRHMEWLGKLVGREAAAKRKAEAFVARLQQLRTEYGARETLRVFYQVQAQPLFTVGGGHTISELIKICGGENIFSDLDSRAHSVSREAVLVRDPQVIVAGQYAGSSDDLSQWHRWDRLTANTAGNLFFIDADLVARPTPGILEGARALCETLQRARENVRGKK